MDFKISFINPTKGEQESHIIDKENCWETLTAVYSKTIPDGKIKPVNFKFELLLDSGALDSKDG